MTAIHPFLTNCPEAARSASPVILDVAFASPTGGTWRAVGGGASFADAIEFARASLPLGHDWRLLDWGDTYGD
jgi:hypothetical protein